MYKIKKVSAKRAFACLLVMFSLLTVFAALAEGNEATETAAEAVEEAVVEAVEETGETAEDAAENTDPDINFLQGLKNIAMSTGIAQSFTENGFEWRNYAMIAVACLLLYLAIVKQFEPLLLLPISFGMLLAMSSSATIPRLAP